jgi:hypothetical protein
MTVFARGTERVKALQHAMGGAPPRPALDKSKALLERYVSERSKQRRAMLKETRNITRSFQEKILSSVPKNDGSVKRMVAEQKRLVQKRSRLKIQKPKLLKIEPQVIAGSNFWLKAPPYDTSWHAGNFSAADAGGGDYQLAVQSFGDGTMEAAAGVAVWFFAPADDPQQRFAALLQYNDDWWDFASGYVAHNDLRTRLWVWGATENRWVVQADVSPNWSDGVGWFESHGNDPAGDAGTISVETFFPVSAGNFYLGWVWSDVNVYADGGFWGIAASSLQFNATVPLIVFGSLF